MSEFKPMVKMYTDEPKAILKLKKGGKVHHKEHHKHHEEHGHKSMHHAHGSMHGAHEAFDSEHGHGPKKPSMHERHKAMNPNQYAKGGKVEKELHAVEKELKHHEHAKHAHGLKKGGKAHHKASGGKIDKAETRTTIEKGAKKFEKTFVVDGEKHDKHHGTGAIKEGKPAGYKHGGHAHHKHHKSTGGEIPADTHEKKNAGKFVRDAVEGNEHDFANTEMHSAKRDRAHGTGGIKESNAGGFKHGGKAHKVHHKATGGAIPAATLKNKREDHLKGDTYEGGDWEDRPADTSTAGVKNRKTGQVKEANAGGYKHGGHASKKAYATGGNVVDDGKAVKMPARIKHAPVANTMQSGTYRRGGKVHHHADGGTEDLSKGAYDKTLKEPPVGMGFASKVHNAIDNFFGAKPASGAVSKTKETVTVQPGKKRGGKAC